jgi:hypothetical protein
MAVVVVKAGAEPRLGTPLLLSTLLTGLDKSTG